jgi:hypothetical protein
MRRPNTPQLLGELLLVDDTFDLVIQRTDEPFGGGRWELLDWPGQRWVLELRPMTEEETRAYPLPARDEPAAYREDEQ